MIRKSLITSNKTNEFKVDLLAVSTFQDMNSMISTYFIPAEGSGRFCGEGRSGWRGLVVDNIPPR